MSRFVILSGPSCAGKGPLHDALKRFRPELSENLEPVVLYNSRPPRPGEKDGIDYHFRPQGEIEKLAISPNVISADVRGDLQALELSAIKSIIDGGSDAFFEGNPFIAARIRDWDAVQNIPALSIFLSPLTREEIQYLTDPARKTDLGEFLTEVMRRKLLRRMKRQKVNFSLPDLKEIERRAASAIVELREAWKFDYVIPNHDGEDSENWDFFYHPIGDARNALRAFAALLNGDEPPPKAERWEKDLVP